MNIKKKNIILLGLAFVMLFMIVGYAGMQTGLLISGTVAVEQSFDVSITGINSTVTGEAYNKTTPAYTGTTATFSVGFNKSGDKMTYEVTIKNNGSVDAFVKSIVPKLSRTATDAGDSFDNVSLLTYGVKPGDILTAGQSSTYTVEVRLDDKPLTINSQEYTVSIDLQYIQNTNAASASWGQLYVPNTPVKLIDNSTWRVINKDVENEKVVLIKEEPLNTTNTPTLFENNEGIDKTVLENYLNTTYKNSLSSSLKSKITNISLPTYQVNTGTYSYESSDMSNFLYYLYKGCSAEYSTSANPTYSVNSCDLGWMGEYNKAAQVNPNTVRKTLRLSDFGMVSNINNNTGGDIYYGNATTVMGLDIQGFDESDPYQIINLYGRVTNSGGYSFHINSIKIEAGGGAGALLPEYLNVYPIITVSLDAIK